MFYFVRDTLRIIIGSLIYSFGLQCLAVPMELLLGGAGGAATVLWHLWGIPVGVSVALFNLPLLILAYFFLGGRALWRTAYATAWFTVAVGVGESLFQYRWQGSVAVAAVLGGIVMGVGLAIIYAGDYVTGGTDLAAQMLAKAVPKLSFGKWLLLMDGVIVLGGSLALGSVEVGLYSVLMIFVYVKVFESYFLQQLLQKGLRL